MPTWIVAHSDEFRNFVVPLLAGFSVAQLRHALNFIDAILVCTARHKTLAALTRLLRLDHADEYAWADFFRVSPWSGETVRTAVTLGLLKTVAALQARTGWRLLFLSVDDSLCVKDVDTTKLQAVSFFYDHVEPRRQQGRFSNASKYVALHLQLGPAQWLLTWRPYYKRSQVKALNRQRRGQGRAPLIYASLITLVEQMLDEIAPHLPKACHVYVLFDSWYASQHLYTFIRAHGWDWIGAAKSNHVLDHFQLAQWWHHLGHQPIERITLRSSKGSHTYATRYRVGRLRRYAEPVLAVISKRTRRDFRPVYFLSSDTHVSVRCLLKYYGFRWQAEIVQSQMTKTDPLTSWVGGDHITDLHLLIRHDHPVDQEFYQRPLLFKGRLGQIDLHSLAKCFDGGHHSRQFSLAIHLSFELFPLSL